MANDLDKTGRLGFLLIDEPARSALREFRPILATAIDALLDDFYRHIQRAPEAAKFFAGNSIDQARRLQRQHWLDNVFTGNFSDQYFAAVVKVGQVHARVGLEPRWYMAGYCFTINKMVELACVHYKKKPERLPQIVNAINKAAFLDMDLAISVYIDALRAKDGS